MRDVMYNYIFCKWNSGIVTSNMPSEFLSFISKTHSAWNTLHNNKNQCGCILHILHSLDISDRLSFDIHCTLIVLLIRDTLLSHVPHVKWKSYFHGNFSFANSCLLVSTVYIACTFSRLFSISCCTIVDRECYKISGINYKTL